jgi:hypothetical protein
MFFPDGIISVPEVLRIFLTSDGLFKQKLNFGPVD